MVDTAWM